MFQSFGCNLGFFFALSLLFFFFHFFFLFFSGVCFPWTHKKLCVCVCVCITKLFCLFLSFHDFSLLSSSGSPLPDFRGLDFFFFGLVHK
jgi:hypothetical protein